MIYIKEVYEQWKLEADGWPITFKPQAPNFHFLPTMSLPVGLGERLTKSQATKCAEG